MRQKNSVWIATYNVTSKSKLKVEWDKLFDILNREQLDLSHGRKIGSDFQKKEKMVIVIDPIMSNWRAKQSKRLDGT